MPDLSTLTFGPEERDQAFLLHPSPALVFDPATRRILAANVAAATLYGWTRDELATMTLDDIRPPSARPLLHEQRRQRDEGVPSTWIRTTHWKRTGEPIEVEVLTQPMRLEGQPVRRAMILDVTARTYAEALFRGVAEQSLTGIYVLQDGRFVYINPRMAEMFGYTVDELMSDADPLRLLTSDARAIANEKMQGRLRGEREQVRYTLHARRRDGSPIVVEVYGSSLSIRGRPALLGTVLDVTERVQADAALAESERRFRAAFDQSMTGMAITAPDGRWLRVNNALVEILGYSAEELTAMSFQEVTHPDDVQSNLDLMNAALAGEIPGYRMEKRFIHRDGGIVWAALSVSLVRDAGGEPLYMVSQVFDVTARKRAEAALGESEAQLRHAQKMEAVGQLAGGVAHDFNNLLTVIGSNAELGIQLAREGKSSADEYAEIGAAVERAAALTRQLLTFSRRQVMAPVPLSLNEVVTHAERMLRRVIGEDVVLKTQLDPCVGEVIADRGQLEQVLMNLIVNARDAMPDGGQVVLATRCEGRGIVSLSVTDSGTGMDAETQARAFEPFFTTKELGKGTGLGLATVYGIARQSGGDVAIRSARGEGTTVTVTLPGTQVSGSSAAPVSRDEEPEAARGPAEDAAVLLVEDEAAVRSVTRRILTRFGYRVIEATDGADALALWPTVGASVRLVLTDAVMPNMGGRELVERLRAAGVDVPILFMSGYANGERGGEVPAGAALIGKPFSAEALGERVAALLGRGTAAPTGSPPG